METTDAPRPGDPLTRRAAVARLGLLAAAAALAGCTPLRIAFRAYPDRYDADGARVARVLRAFADTVVPGADPDAVGEVLSDPFYGLAPYLAYLAADLDRRADDLGAPGFAEAGGPDRTALVRAATTSGDATTRKLYCGAVFLSQVAACGGSGDGDEARPRIGWEGRYRPRPLSELTYPEPERFLAAALTPDGNFA